MLLLLVSVAALTGCTETEPVARIPEDQQLRVVGRVMPFNNVDTKAAKNADESKITNMVMMVTDANGDKIEAQYLESDRPLFIIDRQSDTYTNWRPQTDLEQCHIYIIANVPSAYITLDSDNKLTSFHDAHNNEISTVSDFMGVDYTLSAIGEPSLGFPMWGVTQETNLNLRKKEDGGIANGVLEVPLECLYSKIVFNISVNPTQSVDGVVQKFQMTSWDVHNVPTAVRVQKPDATAQTAHATGTMLSKTYSNTDNNVNPVQEGGGNTMTFSFYMPEHKVNPEGSVTYPTGIDTESKQKYKPQWITSTQKPTYVTIHGIYTDHNEREHEVSYDVYVGGNNYDNFHILRDCQYNNNITIMGVTNSKNGTVGVSLDHRVNVTPGAFKFQLERETLLDSHWEIRPIRITLDHDKYPNAKIQVEILNPTTANWLRMEMPSSPSGTDYCNVSSTDLAYGKRRYFTTDLVSTTLKDNVMCEFAASSTQPEHTIWMYIDENTTLPTSDGSTVRTATVRCSFFEDGNTSGTPDVVEDYLFRQRGLHKITYNGHSYYIEYYEEYLYNFDSNEPYGTLTDGMPWGLNGVMLSNNPAININIDFVAIKKLVKSKVTSAEMDGEMNKLLQRLAGDPYNFTYDFYLTRDLEENNIENAKGSDFSGKSFTKAIAANSNVIKTRPTNEVAGNAIEYCINRNKRKPSDNSIDLDHLSWYLPAIDEIEEITIGGYQSFDVFQDKLYWSSQPAYYKYETRFRGYYGVGGGTYYPGPSSGDYQTGACYIDNSSNARATKVLYNSTKNEYENVSSGYESNAAMGYVTIYQEIKNNLNGSDPPTINKSTYATAPTPAEGNLARTGIARVRCVYKAD